MRFPTPAAHSNNPRQWLVAVTQVVVASGVVAGILILTLSADDNAGRRAVSRIALTSPSKVSVPVSITTVPGPVRDTSSPLLMPLEQPQVTIQSPLDVGSVAPPESTELPKISQPAPYKSHYPDQRSSATRSEGAKKEVGARNEAGEKRASETNLATAEEPTFQQYLEWVRTAEEERSRLRRQGPDLERQLREESILDADAADPANPPPTQRRTSQAVTSTEEALRTSEGRVSRSKPPVPLDCAGFDRYYTQALDAERQGISDLIQAAATGDSARVSALRREATASVDSLLRSANEELERVHRTRGSTAPIRVQTGDSASLLGELTRPGALR